MFRTILLCLLAFATGGVHGETLYRCVAPGGGVAYQDRPCAADARQTGTSEFTPERVPGYRPPTRTAAKKSSRSKQRPAGAGAGTLHGIPMHSDRCRKVRAERDAWERRAGLRRTFEDLRQWQDRVNEACR